MQQLDILASALQMNAGLLQTRPRRALGRGPHQAPERPVQLHRLDPLAPVSLRGRCHLRHHGDAQVWGSGGWNDKFGLPAEDDRLGMGDSLEKVGSFRPTLENLQGYGAAVREKTLACLQSITPEELERELEAPGGATRTAGASLGVLLLDHFHHSGQVCYLRGFITGKGWFAA